MEDDDISGTYGDDASADSSEDRNTGTEVNEQGTEDTGTTLEIEKEKEEDSERNR